MLLLTGLYRLRKLFEKFPPSRLVNLLLDGFFRLRKLISPKPVVSFFRGLVGWNSASEVHQRWTGQDSSNVPVDGETLPSSRPPPNGASEVHQPERWTEKDFSNPDYDRIAPYESVDEETLPGYRPECYYPVLIGEVFHSRYQVVGKLGFGRTSTIWLARDLDECRYVALKVHISGLLQLPELAAYKRLNEGPEDHPGRNAIRGLLGAFVINGDNRQHLCLVYEPLWNDVNYCLRDTTDHRLPLHILTRVLKQVFLALDYAKKCQVIHADISGNNIMFKITDTSLLERYEKRELECPSPRKQTKGRIIYKSRPIGMPSNPADLGVPLLCDFGSAVIGEELQHREAQPTGYRSPEVILGVPWSYEIDIWNVGCMVWRLSQGRPLLTGIADSRYQADVHLAQMISVLGPPSPEFLARRSDLSVFFSPDGEFLPDIPIPPPESLADREKTLKDGGGEGPERDLFLSFIGKMLQWDPRDRQTADQLLEDEWLTARLSKQEETK